MVSSNIDFKSKVKYLYALTDREAEITTYILKGDDKRVIASKLCLSFHTINTHYKNIFLKMRVHSLADLMLKILKD
jgi:DNA-binding NarL/FixJ family response regulator